MPVTGDSLKEALAINLSVALKRRRPAANVTGWASKCADELSVGDRTFQNWLYGPNTERTYSLPQLEHWIALCLYFPGLMEEVLASVQPGIGGDVDPRLLAVAADLTSIAKHLRALGEGSGS